MRGIVEHRLIGFLFVAAALPGCKGCNDGDDGNGPPAVTISIDDVTLAEGDIATMTFVFTVTLTVDPGVDVTLDWATSDGTATTVDSDYTAAGGTLTFTTGGALTQTISVTVNGDTKYEPDETFTITLSNLVNATFADDTAVGMIANDDGIIRVDPTGDGTDGLTWATAFQTVQAGVNAVSAAGEGVVWVAAATYTNGGGTGPVVTMAADVHICGGFEGYAGGFGAQETACRQRDWQTNVTILDGETNAYHVVVGADSSTLDGFTIQNGKANWLSPDWYGAGMYNWSSSPTVTNCTFSDNWALKSGAGIYNFNSSPMVTNCTFSGNSARESGGAMYNYASSPAVTNCTFSGNSAGWYGAGMANDWTSSPAVTNCIFHNNSASSAPEVRNSPLCTPAFSYCDIAGCGGSGAGWDASIGTDGGGNIDADPLLTHIPQRTDETSSGATTTTVEITDAASNYAAGDVIEIGNDNVGRTVSAVGGTTVTFSPALSNAPTVNTIVHNWGAGAADLDFDLHLQSGSPCIDAGLFDLAPLHDKEGYPRIDLPTPNTGAGDYPYVDMGAYEYHGGMAGVAVSGTVSGDVVSGLTVVLSGAADAVTETSREGDYSFGLLADGGYTVQPQAPPGVGFAPTSRAVTVSGSDVTGVDFVASIAVKAAAVIYVDVNASGVEDGTSWTDAFVDLQDALFVAKAGQEIWVAEGIYYPAGVEVWLGPVSFEMKEGVELYGGFSGVETLRGERDWVIHEITLDGRNNAYHVLMGANNAILDGFTVRSGGIPGTSGGGMCNLGVSPTVTNCSFSGNSAFCGGGMYNSLCSPTVTDCTFSGNSADYRGGMYNYRSFPTVTNCTFSGNSAVHYGGGMSNLDSSPMVTNCTFLGNSARTGGGMYNDSSSPVVTNCTFCGNSGWLNWGGGMCSCANSSPAVTNCIFLDNSAPSGPEVYNDTSTPTFSYCEIEGCGGSGAGWDTSIGTDGGGNIDADPLFVDADGADGIYGTPDDDLHLQNVSPCIDAGDGDAAPPTDIEDSARYDDPGTANTGTGTPDYSDIGAYEYHP